MIVSKGSQSRERIEDTDYSIVERIDRDNVLVEDNAIPGRLEHWTLNDDYSGYVLVIDGQGFEFVGSTIGDC